MERSTIEAIKAATDLVALVEQDVKLERAGRLYRGLCPFHQEKTPSFVVFPETGTWHCFGCGKGGDAVSYLMRRERLTFTEAVHLLAERAGLPLPSAPPRAGIERHALDALVQLDPQTIAYVSCDPSTLARDAKRLSEAGYTLKQVTPFDLFPQTYHIESISIFTKDSR